MSIRLEGPDPEPKDYGDKRRTVRFDDELWDALAEASALEGTTASAVLREAARRYVRRSRRHHNRKGHRHG